MCKYTLITCCACNTRWAHLLQSCQDGQNLTNCTLLRRLGGRRNEREEFGDRREDRCAACNPHLGPADPKHDRKVYSDTKDYQERRVEGMFGRDFKFVGGDLPEAKKRWFKK